MSPRPPRPTGTILKSVSLALARTADGEPDEEALGIARTVLLTELNDFAERCGYTRSETRETVTVDRITITGMMSPRQDGEWPLIHAAIRQDAEDLRKLSLLGDLP